MTTEFACRHPGKTTNPHSPHLHVRRIFERIVRGSSRFHGAPCHWNPDCRIGYSSCRLLRGSWLQAYVWFHQPRWCQATRRITRYDWSFARNIEDAAFFVSILTGRESLILQKSQSPPRVGICRTYECPNAAPETITAFEKVEKRLFASEASVRAEASGTILTSCRCPYQGYELRGRPLISL